MLFIADTCDDEILGGGGGSGSNVTSFTFDPATDIANVSTDLPASFNATIQGVRVDQTFFVSDVYGNNATAQQGSMNYKYKTLDAALTAATAFPDAVIYIMPGAYTINTSYTVNGWRKIYCMPGASIQVLAGVAFPVDPGYRLEIKGYGEWNLGGYLFYASNPNSSAIADVTFEGNYLGNATGTPWICDTTSLKIYIEVDAIFDVGMTGAGWSDVNMKVDRWISSISAMYYWGDDTTADGLNKITQNGPRKFNVKGRYQPKTKLNRPEGSTATYGFYIYPTTSQTNSTQAELHCELDTMDSFFWGLNGGKTRWWGNGIHRRSGLAGNEIPWIFCDQAPLDDTTAPYFEHVEGSIVSGLYNGSNPAVIDPAIGLNNEIWSIRIPGTFVFNGRYKNSGANVGLGAFPIGQFSNQSINPGHTRIVLNCEMANVSKNSSLVQILDVGNPSHTYKLIVMKTTCEHPETECITVNIPDVPIYVFHSLAMTQPYSSNFINGMSYDRTVLDRQIEVIVPEYVA